MGTHGWVETVDPADAEGVLAEAYAWQAAGLGRPAEFTQLGSLYPELVMERLRLYRVVDGCPSALTPVERAAAALVTSTLNGTDHCASGARLTLESLGVEADVIDAMTRQPAAPDTGDDRLDAVCAHAVKLTRYPQTMAEADLDRLREHGLGDLEIVDLNNIVAYYCYINRVVMGLGLRTTMNTTHEATRARPT